MLTIKADVETTVAFTNAEPTFPVKIGKRNPKEEYLEGAGLTLSALDIPVAELVDGADGVQLEKDTLGGDPVFLRVISTGTDASVVDLKVGSYLLEETTVPENYRKAADMRVNVAPDGTVTVWSVEAEETEAGITLTEIPNTRMSGTFRHLEIDMVDEPYVVVTFHKRWTDARGEAAFPWPEGASIEVAICAGAADSLDHPESQDELDEAVTLVISKPAEGDMTITQMKDGVEIAKPEYKVTFACAEAENDYQFTVAGLPALEEGMTYHCIETPVEGYQAPQYIGNGTIENRLNVTSFSFTKLWKDASYGDDTWDGKSIQISLYRKVEDGEGELVWDDPVTLNSDGGQTDTYTWAAASGSEVSDEALTFTVSGLPALDGEGWLYTYYLTEIVDDAYEPTYYYASDTGLLRADDGVAYDGYIIVNLPAGNYELPHTGGPGTARLYGPGALLTAFAALMLWRRRKMECD